METTETQQTSDNAMPADLAEALEDAGLAEAAAEKPGRGEAPVPRPARAERREAAKAAADADDEAGGAVSDDEQAALDAAAAAEGEEGDAKDKETPEAKAAAELAADTAELKAVRARADKRRRDAIEARRGTRPADAATPPASAQAAAGAATAATAKPPTADEASVAKAVRDVISQIAKLTAEDEAAVASGDPKTSAEAKARATELTALRAKVDGISGVLDENKALRDKFGTLEQKLQEQADRAFVMNKIETLVDARVAELPNLAKLRNPAALIYDRAEKFFKDHGRAPSLAFVAEAVERVLARRAGESPETTAKAAETKTNGKRKTVSTSHSSPPAARTGPDTRTKEQVERDLFVSVGLPVDDD